MKMQRSERINDAKDLRPIPTASDLIWCGQGAQSACDVYGLTANFETQGVTA